eukprot:TRINITY_DN10474_c0_g1_i1.p1 TRINITY_DN10474_c0_g1~~TRINITY_DN10474_c0_g1_i1.p1  ORF type:complete len:183 (+),score=43.05 TRINITY_DN10474_c0_g1_i1:49-549(+)
MEVPPPRPTSSLDHPYKLLTPGQRQLFLAELQAYLNDIVEDPTISYHLASLLETYRPPRDILQALEDTLQDDAKPTVSWMWTRMKEILEDEELANLEVFTWDSLQPELNRLLVGYQSGEDIDFENANHVLKRNVIPLVSGPGTILPPGPTEPNYPPLVVLKVLVEL